MWSRCFRAVAHNSGFFLDGIKDYNGKMKPQTQKKYAALLCHYCLSLKPKERVLIRTTTAAEPFLAVVYEEVLKCGAIPVVELGFKQQDALFFTCNGRHARNP